MGSEMCIRDSIEGGLRFFEGDTEYGKGFAGYLYTKFSKLGVTALSKGVFGRKNDFSYFNVDALASFPEVAKIILPMGLNGLGGGLSYNMAVTDTLEHLPLDMDLEFDTTTIFNMPLGESLTGTEYIPDISKGLNVKLIVAGNIGEEAICSYNAVFEIKFSDTTFLEASLKGTVKMMDSLGLDDIPFFPKVDNFFSGIEFLNWDPPNVEAPVKGYFSIIFSSCGSSCAPSSVRTRLSKDCETGGGDGCLAAGRPADPRSTVPSGDT